MNNTSLNIWKDTLFRMKDPTVLLTGAKPWKGSPQDDLTTFAPHAKWLSTDIIPSDAVDYVADLHDIDKVYPELRVDGVFSPSTLEHVERPWDVIKAMANVLKPGGAMFVRTHQTFPLHYYPKDYFRFSTEALESMCIAAGLVNTTACYEMPVKIQRHHDMKVWCDSAPAYLWVSCFAMKPPS